MLYTILKYLPTSKIACKHHTIKMLEVCSKKIPTNIYADNFWCVFLAHHMQCVAYSGTDVTLSPCVTLWLQDRTHRDYLHMAVQNNTKNGCSQIFSRNVSTGLNESMLTCQLTSLLNILQYSLQCNLADCWRQCNNKQTQCGILLWKQELQNKGTDRIGIVDSML